MTTSPPATPPVLRNARSAHRARAAALALALAPLACGGSKDAPPSAPAGSTPKLAPAASALRVEVATYEGSSGADRLLRPGEVRGARQARLAAALGGFVEAVLARSGATVRQGQPIARIDASTHAAQVALTQVELDDARRELARAEGMAEALPPARLDAARTRVARAEAQLRLARSQESRAVVRAPFAGVLGNLDLEPGEVAAPGQPIATVVVLDPVRVSVSVPGRDVGALRIGGAATVLAVGGGARLEGKIVRVEPAADPSTRTFAVEVEARNPERALLPGMVVQVELARDGVEGALLLPQDILVTRLQDNGVFLVEEGAGGARARWRPVGLGRVIGDQLEILDGLARGDRLVVIGQRALSDGDPVLITRQGRCCRDGRVQYDLAAQAARPAEAGAGPAGAPAPRPTEAAP